MKSTSLCSIARITHLLITLHAVVLVSTTSGKDTRIAAGKLKPLSETSVAHIADRLKARPVGEVCSAEQMMEYLGIDIMALGWEGGAPSGTEFFGALKEPNRSISVSQVRNEVRSVEVIESKSGTVLLAWTPTNGLNVPERATADVNATYLVDQPITVPWSQDKSGYIDGDLARRAAQWHDSRIDAWNKAFGGKIEDPFYPAIQEIGRSRGTFTLRIPKQYESDGTWGMVIVFGSRYGRYLSHRLRTACDQHRCLLAEIQPDWRAPGRIWRDLSQIMDGVATLRKSYNFAPARTVLLGSGYGWPVGFAGALFPDVFRFVALDDSHPFIPSDVGSGKNFSYIRETWGSDWELQPFPLGWMTPADWQRNSKAGQRWLWMDGASMSQEAFEKVLQPAWSAVNIQITLLPGWRENEAALAPMRCWEAEFIHAAFK